MGKGVLSLTCALNRQEQKGSQFLLSRNKVAVLEGAAGQYLDSVCRGEASRETSREVSPLLASPKESLRE